VHPFPDQPGVVWEIKQYNVKAVLYLPDVGTLDLPVRYLAWARPMCWNPGGGGNTTAPLVYSGPEDTQDQMWRLAQSITDCDMSQVNGSSGRVTLSGHNLAHIWDEGGVHHVSYLVPKANWRMAYTIVSNQDFQTSGLERLRPRPASAPVAFSVQSPVTGPVKVDYAMPQEGHVEVEVFDVSGRMVAALDLGAQRSGKRSLTWQRTDDAGRLVDSGVYWITLRVNGKAATKRIVLLN
jgi:hypothetical protein